MITTKGTRIWTPYGYKFVDDLYIGEKVISFNPERGVCEYDTIQGIQIEFKSCMGYGINSKSMRMILTEDHDILVFNVISKQLTRVPLERIFLKRLRPYKEVVLCSAPFEPFLRSQEIEDIKWSARIASSIVNHRYAYYDLDDIVRDLGGYEAQIWLDTFFHWNKLVAGKNYMASIKLINTYVRDLVFHVAPRAGVGANWHRAKEGYIMSITTNGDVFPRNSAGWFRQRIDEPVFNVTTTNGNVLAKATHGTFLVACKRREDDVKTL